LSPGERTDQAIRLTDIIKLMAHVGVVTTRRYDIPEVVANNVGGHRDGYRSLALGVASNLSSALLSNDFTHVR